MEDPPERTPAGAALGERFFRYPLNYVHVRAASRAGVLVGGHGPSIRSGPRWPEKGKR